MGAFLYSIFIFFATAAIIVGPCICYVFRKELTEAWKEYRERKSKE